VIGTQSVGGGASTLYLMRRELIERRGWLTHREFLEDWALCKLSLGINLIALTGLVGSRLGGSRGALVSVVALLVPAGVITAVMTAGYTVVRDDAIVRSALSGAGPVTAGMTTGIAYTFARQAVRRGRHAWIDWGYAAAIVAAGLLLGATPLLVIASGIVVGFVALRGESSRATADPGS
jgi:chromate transporter